MKRTNSRTLFSSAQRLLVGGVNSPVRAYKSVGGSPLFITRGKASSIYDADNNRYIDYVMSWGALMLGHAHPHVVAAVTRAVKKGTSFGAPTRGEIELAKIISYAIPSIEKVRLVSSGTEAAMSAIRLARGFTGKNKVVKFEGCYHGHSDSLLVKAGSGLATYGRPDSLGVTEGTSKDTIVIPYNDIDAVRAVIKKEHRSIACMIVEPVAANMGVILPQIGFLVGLRELTAKYNIVLIFDEVITGFRFTFGGAQNLFGIQPDLTCLGKIIGGGLPLAAYGGRKEIMDYLSPLGGVYQAGTLSGNPIAVSAGIAQLTELARRNYAMLNEVTAQFCHALESIIHRSKARCTLNRAGSIFTLFFSPERVFDFSSAKKCDTKRFARFFWSMLGQGIYLAPSQFEANFFSFVHTAADFEKTVKAARKAIEGLS